MDILNQLVGPILLAILTPLAAAVGMLLAQLIKRAIAHIDNAIAQQLAWQAVIWVEQTFTDLHGKDKFNKAYEWLAKKLPGVEKEDIEKFIETAVKEMNNQFPKVSNSQPK